MSNDLLGIIDDQGRLNKEVKVKQYCPTLRAEAHGNDPKVVMPALRSERFGLKVGISIKGEQMNKSDNSNYPGIYVKLSDDCTVYAIWYPKYECYIAIRKLTPKECFRLQGWADNFFKKAQLVNSDSQLYKQAGNGVTVNVVYEIAKRIPV